MKLLSFKEKVLTVLEVPEESDGFEFATNYADWVKVYLTREAEHGHKEKEVRETQVRAG